jgi:hypothetical protein
LPYFPYFVFSQSANASSLSDLGNRSEKFAATGQILPTLQRQYRDIDQKGGEIWTEQRILQPITPKSDRLLARQYKDIYSSCQCWLFRIRRFLVGRGKSAANQW